MSEKPSPAPVPSWEHLHDAHLDARLSDKSDGSVSEPYCVRTDIVDALLA